MVAKRLRCAIYTRKSTSEGLDQEFNSLDAQREACAAYIKSQRHEGWTPVRTRYDDGGLSGATMERPALARLLDEIRARRVDIVVVYKVDRLTRALSDFAKMVEIFDAHGVSFVSVTQQFNTTSSMGRLTLNVLLSFAQFEREVTAERIRDKIAASKRKGMWMGGVVPLGYDSVDKRLVTNSVEARVVRRIFDLYDELGTVRAVKHEVDRLGLRTKSRGEVAGLPFSRGHLYKLLGNPIYAGNVRHGSVTYAGEHDAIIPADLWDRVQGRLKANAVDRKSATMAPTSLLAGLLFTKDGQRLIPSHTNKRGRRYRYYTTRVADRIAEQDAVATRLPAAELEAAVLDGLVRVLKDETMMSKALEAMGVLRRRALEPALRRASELAERVSVSTGGVKQDTLRRLVERIEIEPDNNARFSIRAGVLTDGQSSGQPDRQGGVVGDLAEPLIVVAPIDVPGRSHGRSATLSSQRRTGTAQDPKLIRAVAEGYGWYERMRCGEFATVGELAASVGRDRPDVGRRLRLAFLAPDIVAAIVAGEQPSGLTIGALLRERDIPLSWAEQRRVLGFPDPRDAGGRSTSSR